MVVTGKKHHIASCSKTENFKHILFTTQYSKLDNACFEFFTYNIGGGDLQGPKQKALWLTKDDKDGKSHHCSTQETIGQPWYNPVILTG